MSRASEYRKKRQQADEPTGEIALPSGAVFIMRRPPLQVWIASGKMPQSFLKRSIETGQGGAVKVEPEEIIPSVIFLRDAITYACVSPRLVVGGTGEDELDPSELAPEDFEFLSAWVAKGCPGVPVKTKEGEVSVDNLARFPQQKRPGGKPFSLEPDGGEVQSEAEPITRTA